MKSPLLEVSLAVVALFAIGISYLTRPLPDRESSYASRSQSDALGGWSVEYLPQNAFLQGAASPEPATLALPVRLKIPNINVDAAVVYVGLTPDGAMDTPKLLADVAWLQSGTVPGEAGTAAVAGHYGRKNGETSVFDKLHTLRKGDRVLVEDDKGATTSFVVRESRRYKPDANAPDVFISTDGKAHLNLITCEGAWNDAQGGYPTRLVVFTEKESE